MKFKIEPLGINLNIQVKDLYKFGGVLSIGVVGYLAYKQLSKRKQTAGLKPQKQQQKSFRQIYQQVIQSVQQVITQQKLINGRLIKCILSNQYKLALNQKKALMLKDRLHRRQLMSNKHQYSRSILQFDRQLEELTDKNLNAIIAHFHIDKTRWIEAVDDWTALNDDNREQWENLLIDLDNQQLDQLRNATKQPLSLKKLQQIYQFKIYSLQHLNQSGLDLDSSISEQDNDLNSRYILIDMYITDLVYKKFNVQQEDINYSQKFLTQKEKDQFINISDSYTDLIRKDIFGDQSQDSDGDQWEDQEQQDQYQDQQQDQQQEQQEPTQKHQ